MLQEKRKLDERYQAKDFHGYLEHKNPICEECGRHCYSIYSGGNKERVLDVYICRNCKIVFCIHDEKKCEFVGGKNHD